MRPGLINGEGGGVRDKGKSLTMLSSILFIRIIVIQLLDKRLYHVFLTHSAKVLIHHFLLQFDVRSTLLKF